MAVVVSEEATGLLLRKFSYYIGETPLVTTCTHYGNLIQVPYQQPRQCRDPSHRFSKGIKA